MIEEKIVNGEEKKIVEEELIDGVRDADGKYRKYRGKKKGD